MRLIAKWALVIAVASAVAFVAGYCIKVVTNTYVCQSEDSDNCLWVDLGTDGGRDTPVIQWHSGERRMDDGTGNPVWSNEE